MQRQGLYRSSRDRVFGGVAAGIAYSLRTDPAIVRLIFALLVIAGGGGLLLYLILWIALPEEPIEFFQNTPPAGDPGTYTGTGAAGDPAMPVDYPVRKNNGALIAGLILIGIGVLFLADRLLPHINIHFRDLWPIVIVIAGIALIYSSFTGNKNR